MKKYKKIELKQTCFACPEQYDAFFKDKLVGYLRLKHGYFIVKHNGKTVYDADTIGNGMFAPKERKKHLKKAKKAIYKSIKVQNKNYEE